jgi:hypothetical protein
MRDFLALAALPRSSHCVRCHIGAATLILCVTEEEMTERAPVPTAMRPSLLESDTDEVAVAVPDALFIEKLLSEAPRVVCIGRPSHQLQRADALRLQHIFFHLGFNPTAVEVDIALGIVALQHSEVWEEARCDVNITYEPWGTPRDVPPLPCADTRSGGALIVPTVRLVRSEQGAVAVQILQQAAPGQLVHWLNDDIGYVVQGSAHVHAHPGEIPGAPMLLNALCTDVRVELPCGEVYKRRHWGVSVHEVRAAGRSLRRHGSDACTVFLQSKYPQTADPRARRAVRLVYICASAYLDPRRSRVLCALARVTLGPTTMRSFTRLVDQVADATRECTWSWGIGALCAVVSARAIGARCTSVGGPGVALILSGACPEPLHALDATASAILEFLV